MKPVSGWQSNWIPQEFAIFTCAICRGWGPHFVTNTRNIWPLAGLGMYTFYTPTEQGFADYPEYGSFGD